MTIFMSDGSLLKREVTPAGGTYATIPQATKITPPKWVRKTTDVYIHDQSAPVTKPGALEAMEVQFDLAWDPTDATYHQVLFSDLSAKTSRNYKIVLPDTGSAEIAFAAIVSAIEPADLDAEGGNPLAVTVTLKLAAEPTVTW